MNTNRPTNVGTHLNRCEVVMWFSLGTSVAYYIYMLTIMFIKPDLTESGKKTDKDKVRKNLLLKYRIENNV